MPRRLARCLFLAAGLVGGLWGYAQAEGCCRWPQEATFILGQVELGPEFRTYDVGDFQAAKRLPADWLLYEAHGVTLIGLIDQLDPEHDTNPNGQVYNLRSVLPLSATVLDRLVSGRDDGERVLPANPLCYVLLAPNSTLKACLTRNLRVSIGTRTDIGAYRNSYGERGVLFTPRLGLELAGAGAATPEKAWMNRIFVNLGYGNWWSWDADSRGTGWRVSFGATFYPDV